MNIIIALAGGIVLAAAALGILYFTRIQTMRSMERLTEYDDGYNLYRMNVKYKYSLAKVIQHGIRDDQSLLEAVVKESLPLIPVSIRVPSFGCTAFTLKDSNGSVHMGRNYDFKNDTSAMLVYCTPQNGYRSIAFAALDNVSANVPDKSLTKKLATLTAPFICLDGLNEKGVSIAVLTLDSAPVSQHTGKPVLATTLAIRLVLDNATTTQEAVELLRRYDMLASSGRDYHFYITDASGDGRVVEYDCESEKRELIDTASLAVTNFYILYKDKVLPYQKNGIYGHGKERYNAVLKVLKNEEGSFSAGTVWNALQAAAQDPNPEDITSNTQWSINYNNTALTADIVIRRHWGDHYEYFFK